MMEIDCPWCGPRNQDEFSCGGEAHIRRPDEPESICDREWADYLYMRVNPRDIHHERWLHLYGCGQWFHVARDMITHKIEHIYRLSERPPGEANER